MKKSEVQLYGGRPALNVKVYNLPSIEEVTERFKCSDDDAERALGFAFETAQETFWRDIEETAQSIFGSYVKTLSEGRSSGWLTVHNMEPVEEWNAVMLSKWNRFARLVETEIKHLTSSETMLDDIEVNRWAEPMSEKFNFYQTATKKTVCVAELNQMVAAYRQDLLA